MSQEGSADGESILSEEGDLVMDVSSETPAPLSPLASEVSVPSPTQDMDTAHVDGRVSPYGVKPKGSNMKYTRVIVFSHDAKQNVRFWVSKWSFIL